ncbi:MAG: 3'(2'),5'-bisphosphate nucleotidase [Ilumatobacter sp.]|uniref:3'(2'),5'-bisphosphate nucleotidase n=1 Tax=Ilumatobacter sp. TaxID=1967498 RepID=UPI003C72FD61
METPTRSVAPETIAAAVSAVDRAARATTAAQGRLASGDTLTKDDESPVTVADFAAQAIVCRSLADALGDVAVVGEEHPDDLADRPGLTVGIAELAAVGLGVDSLSIADVVDAVGLGTATAHPGGTYWTLDPIDGTKGFLRNAHYAIALALIEDGEVVLGVLGCPNMTNDDMTNEAGSDDDVSTGVILVGANGVASQMASGSSGAHDAGRPVRVDDPATLADARFCESVESGHSDQDQSSRIAQLLGIDTDPFRIDSQCKYAAVARGDASIYLRLPTRADYVEKIWDHAAGKFVVECAGGVVTDVRGNPLDFSIGDRLTANSGVIATSGRFHADIVAAVGSVLDS